MNLALNMEDHGFSVLVWNRNPDAAFKAIEEVGARETHQRREDRRRVRSRP